MKPSIWSILFVFLFLFTSTSAQDYTKLTQLQGKLQSIMQQMQANQNDPVKMEQLSKQFEALTKEMEKESLKLMDEIGGDPSGSGTSGEGTNAEKLIAKQKALIDSYPPILKKIHKLHCDIIDMDSFKDRVKMNAASEEIIQLMGEIYSDKTKVGNKFDSFIVSLTFVKETIVALEMKGRGAHPDTYDINYHFKTDIPAIWKADYMVDVIKQKGYLLGYSVFTDASETKPETVNMQSLSGTKVTISIGAGASQGPVDKYKLFPGSASVTIGPSKNKTIDYFDSNTWPDEVVDEYTVTYTPPFLMFLSSHDQFEDLGVPVPCGTNMQGLTYVKPAEINEGISKGKYTKEITGDTSFPDCKSSTVSISVDFPNLICDELSDKGAVATSGACIDHGGFILATEDDVFISGKPVARVGDKVLCLRHGLTEIVGDKNVDVYSEKKRIARVGDKTKCGAEIMGGGFGVYAGTKK